jgi:hypothetical protein
LKVDKANKNADESHVTDSPASLPRGSNGEPPDQSDPRVTHNAPGFKSSYPPHVMRDKVRQGGHLFSTGASKPFSD